MKERPEGFLAQSNLDHDSEAFDYIRELHEYLWRVVRLVMPSANGDLSSYVDPAIERLGAADFPPIAGERM